MAPASPTPSSASEVPCIRSYLYAGGEYVDNGSGGHIFSNQIYVEKLLPVNGVRAPHPVILIHGAGQTGTNFLNKPDGGRGWASELIDKGFEVYILDQASRGRSATKPGAGEAVTIPAEEVEKRFTAPAKFGLWPQAAKHTQWPGSGLRGDPIFDAFYASNIQFEADNVSSQIANQKAGADLLDRIKRPCILVGHSQGGSLPLLIADARPQLTAGVLLLEPRGPPFLEGFTFSPSNAWGLTDIPITYSPPVNDPSELVQQEYRAVTDDTVPFLLQADNPRPRTLVNLADLPIMVVTTEASYHAQYDHATAAYLRQAGCHKTIHLKLADIGIHGNGHMFFMEKNSSEILAKLDQWLRWPDEGIESATAS